MFSFWFGLAVWFSDHFFFSYLEIFGCLGLFGAVVKAITVTFNVYFRPLIDFFLGQHGYVLDPLFGSLARYEGDERFNKFAFFFFSRKES